MQAQQFGLNTQRAELALATQPEVDAYLRQADEEFEAFRRRVRQEYPEAHRRLDALLQPAPPARP